MEYVLKTSNLSKHYGNLKAVDNVSMQIRKGDIYGFVGKNGAGKTTIIRLITGLIKKTSGNFELFGIPDTDEGQLRKKRISGIVDTPSLYLNLSAYDNIFMQMKTLGLEKPEEIEGLLRLVGLDSSDRRPVKNYSLGMKQRLGIAIALVGDPEFLILDEPTNGLDPAGIVEIRELLTRLNREQGITIMISSHILTELAKLATTYGFIDRGRLIQEISAEELEKHCQKSIRLSVSSTQSLTEVLDTLKIKNYKIINGNDLYIYQEVEISALVAELANKGIAVKKITEQNEDLESYFINLVGGRKSW